MGNFGWEIRKISPHSKTKMSIPPDVIRKAEMQMKRKAPDDLNGEQHKTRSKKANAAARRRLPLCSLTTLWKSSFVTTRWRALRSHASCTENGRR